MLPQCMEIRPVVVSEISAARVGVGRRRVRIVAGSRSFFMLIL